MKLLKNLYVSENIKNKDEIINSLSKNIKLFEVYLICSSRESKNLFEIFESSQLFKKINIQKNWTIVGIANSKDDATELLKRIFSENIKENFNYLKEKFLDN